MRLSLYGRFVAAFVSLNVLGLMAADCISPNGQNVISFKLSDGLPQYDVAFAGKVVIRDSALGLNIHDGYIADGMRRTYPNLLTQEGGGGRETNPTITHELMLPFTLLTLG